MRCRSERAHPVSSAGVLTPELHSIHHQFDVHRYNFGDIPLCDRLFGTYQDTTAFAPRCGFPQGAESKLISMLAFKDVYFEDPEATVRSARNARGGEIAGACFPVVK